MSHDEDLTKLLQDKFIYWPEDREQSFLPNGVIDDLLTLENIYNALSIIYGNDSERLEKDAQEIFRSRKKLFCLLLCGSLPKRMKNHCIRFFIDKSITDRNLPFHRYDSEATGLNVCSLGSHCRRQGVDGQCITQAMEDWSRKQRMDFCRDQWSVLAPVFSAQEGVIPHYDFDPNSILPFRKDNEKVNASKGGYSQVWLVQIVAEHQNLYQPTGNDGPEPPLAIKRLISKDKVAFERERDMLSWINALKHKHLVRLLATYSYDGKYHLIFPYADANLRTFWDSIPKPNWNRATYLWVLDQMTGIAGGLTAIHLYHTNPAYTADPRQPGPALSRFMTDGRVNFQVAKEDQQYGRHGDLKPDNLLWKADEQHTESHGILIITDLGLGEIHRDKSKSGRPPNVGGSATYVPPELDLLNPVSRAFDIWCLACVYLEFLTWLLTGRDGLEKFHDLRMNFTLDKVFENDTYYTICVSPTGNKYAVVRQAVVDCIRDLRHHERCSQMVREILDLVEKSMLLINPKERISADKLQKKLWDIHDRAQKDSEFLAGKEPTHEGFGFNVPQRQ